MSTAITDEVAFVVVVLDAAEHNFEGEINVSLDIFQA
jgi:hypothetical protein